MKPTKSSDRDSNVPSFRYHPDPIGSGSIIASDQACRCCGRARGYVYHGPVYAEATLDDCLCPWCISDGSAHRRFDAVFTDSEGIADGAPASAIEEVEQRTPGYAAWQGEQWPVCCGDIAAFLLPAGIAEIRAVNYAWEGQLMAHIVHEMGISGGAATRLLQTLRRDASPTAFLFQCLHCEKMHFYVDSA